jgi:pyrroline-5-carboxylate reductase
MVRLGFIGFGNMAKAMIQGILDRGISDPMAIIASDKVSDQSKLEAAKKLEITLIKGNKEVVKNSDIIFIAVKPQDIDSALNEIREEISQNKIIVSIAAGISIGKIESIIGNKKIVRVMPNLPCLVAEMAAGISYNKNVLQKEKETIEIILQSCGKTFEIDESLMDAVTGLSGSGPAFTAYLIEAFKEAGKENGLPEETAYQLALKTFEGTAKLLQQKKMPAQDLINMVSSPKGTTVAGREILESSDVKEIIKKTVLKATARSKELGK